MGTIQDVMDQASVLRSQREAALREDFRVSTISYDTHHEVEFTILDDELVLWESRNPAERGSYLPGDRILLYVKERRGSEPAELTISRLYAQDVGELTSRVACSARLGQTLSPTSLSPETVLAVMAGIPGVRSLLKSRG